MSATSHLDDAQFFCVCAAFRRVTVDDIAHLLDDSALRDLLRLVRQYGDVMRAGGSIMDYTEIDHSPTPESRHRAESLARVLGINPADDRLLPPEIVYIDPAEFGFHVK
jgi:hypothetical protein